jgi:hypothetical protein
VENVQQDMDRIEKNVIDMKNRYDECYERHRTAQNDLTDVQQKKSSTSTKLTANQHEIDDRAVKVNLAACQMQVKRTALIESRVLRESVDYRKNTQTIIPKRS